jgi:hypothetical protein
MTWITCPKCGCVDTVSSVNVVFKPEPNPDGSLKVADIWHGAERWVCPGCGWRAEAVKEEVK